MKFDVFKSKRKISQLAPNSNLTHCLISGADSGPIRNQLEDQLNRLFDDGEASPSSSSSETVWEVKDVTPLRKILRIPTVTPTQYVGPKVATSKAAGLRLLSDCRPLVKRLSQAFIDAFIGELED